MTLAFLIEKRSTETPINLGSMVKIPITPAGGLVLELIRPGDLGYDKHRNAWNKLYDRKPAIIARCHNAREVAEALRFAKENNLPVAVRSGGHSVAGYSTIEGGVLIDLSSMKTLTIDPERRTALAEPGLTWGEYSTQAARYGLATPSGDTSSVGVGGLTLGGGIGWLARKHGLTIDHLVSAEIVTAQGEIITASETEHSDLFWAIRGGGGNFGIVTRFEFRLVSVPQILAGTVVFPAEPKILAAYAKAALEMPDELTTIAEIMKTPPMPFLSPDLYGKVNLLVQFCYTGDPEEGQRVISRLASIGPVLGQMAAPMPYPDIYKFNEMATISKATIVRNHFLDGLDEETAQTLIESANDHTLPFPFIQLRPLGGQYARVPAEATAFAHRNSSVLVVAISGWKQTSDDEVALHAAWAEHLWQNLSAKSVGSYVGFQADEDSDGSLTRNVYPAATYNRLAEVKAKYDPDNLFKANRNITPATSK